jgi:hypothetical protein
MHGAHLLPFEILLFTLYLLLFSIPSNECLYLFAAEVIADLLGRRLEESGIKLNNLRFFDAQSV